MMKDSEYNISAFKPNTEHNLILGQQFTIDELGYIHFCRQVADNEEPMDYLCPGKEDLEIDVKRPKQPLYQKRHKHDSSQGKPQESYAYIIYKALESSPKGKLTLFEIYEWIENTYLYYKTADPVWKNSIRHNLSLNAAFKKIPRPMNSKGKGGYWAIDHSVSKNEKIMKRKRSTGFIETSDSISKIINEKSGKLVF